MKRRRMLLDHPAEQRPPGRRQQVCLCAGETAAKQSSRTVSKRHGYGVWVSRGMNGASRLVASLRRACSTAAIVKACRNFQGVGRCRTARPAPRRATGSRRPRTMALRSCSDGAVRADLAFLRPSGGVRAGRGRPDQAHRGRPGQAHRGRPGQAHRGRPGQAHPGRGGPGQASDGPAFPCDCSVRLSWMYARMLRRTIHHP